MCTVNFAFGHGNLFKYFQVNINTLCCTQHWLTMACILSHAFDHHPSPKVMCRFVSARHVLASQLLLSHSLFIPVTIHLCDDTAVVVGCILILWVPSYQY